MKEGIKTVKARVGKGGRESPRERRREFKGISQHFM